MGLAGCIVLRVDGIDNWLVAYNAHVQQRQGS